MFCFVFSWVLGWQIESVVTRAGKSVGTGTPCDLTTSCQSSIHVLNNTHAAKRREASVHIDNQSPISPNASCYRYIDTPLVAALLPLRLSDRKWIDDHRLLPIDNRRRKSLYPGNALVGSKGFSAFPVRCGLACLPDALLVDQASRFVPPLSTLEAAVRRKGKSLRRTTICFVKAKACCTDAMLRRIVHSPSQLRNSSRV